MDELKQLIQDFQESTGSALARQVLADFDSYLPNFWQVIPPAEDNSPLTHPDAESTSTPPNVVVVNPNLTRQSSGSRSGAATVTMSASPTGSQFRIQNFEQGKGEALDRNYWGKNL